MGASFQAELIKTGRRPVTWLLLAVWVILGLTFGYLLPYMSYRNGSGMAAEVPREQQLAELLPASLTTVGVSGLPMFGGAIALVLGALATGGEYGFGTWKTVLVQRPGRIAVYAGKCLAMALVTLMQVLGFFAVGAVASAVIAELEAASGAWPSAGELVTAIAAGWLLAGMWCGIGMFLGVWLRNTALAVGLGLVWTLVVENLLRILSGGLGVLETISDWLPGTNAGSVAAALGVIPITEPGGTPGVVAAVTGAQATGTVAGYLLLSGIVAIVILRRRDVN